MLRMARVTVEAFSFGVHGQCHASPLHKGGRMHFSPRATDKQSSMVQEDRSPCGHEFGVILECS